MREYENIKANFDGTGKIDSGINDQKKVFEQLKNENMDSSSMDILRKLAFLKLVEASKKYHMQKLQGKDGTALEKMKKSIEKLYQDYNRVKDWSRK